jgi:2-dehydropantoate 2-reductase
MSTQRVLIQGIGGIGGVMAAAMIHAGHNPVLVTGNANITRAIEQNGIHARMPGGRTLSPKAEVYTGLDQVPRSAPFDAAYMIMKAAVVVDSARRSIPLLREDGYVVTFQNGIVEDAVAEAIGGGRVVSGIIGWGGTMHGPGVYEKTSPGETHIGELDGGISERVKSLGRAIESSAPVVISNNIRGALWSKLAINCTITTIGALTGETLGQMMGDKNTRLLMMKTYTEVIDTAEASGIRLERIAADPRMLYLPHDAGWFEFFKKDLIGRVIGFKYRKVKSSMLQGLERGRPTEIDFLNGYVVAQAAKAGVAVPYNTALVRMIKEIESGKRKMLHENLRELALAA